jgi:hypothetical protein
MFQTLRIVFTILSAICIAIVIPVGVFGGLTASVVCAVAAFIFFVIMLFFKQKQEESEPQPKEPDFMDENDIQK